MTSVSIARCLTVIGLLATSLACGSSEPEPLPAPSLDEARLLDHIRTLASDDFLGRAPGTPGEERTVTYLTETFEGLGLEPGNPDGTYSQRVPLVGVTPTDISLLTFGAGDESLELVSGQDFVATAAHPVPQASLDGAEVVFVGYGTQAPEFGWDDFKGMDVAGRVLLVLVNDPPGEDIFGGEAMTYYGRWTYKYEKARALGAAGVFIVHETGPAGYPWEVVQGSWSGEQFNLASASAATDQLAIQGWLQLDQARALAELAGLSLDDLMAQARSPGFQPVSMGVTASVSMTNTVRNILSQNVVARVSGAEAPGETVLYVAHWDHLGRDDSLPDPIYNGAVDNASGTAGLLELARVFSRLPTPPRRSVLFLAVTAEEQGLLGSRFYAENPLYPLAQTVAVINMDGLNVLGRTRDLTIIGMGQSTLEDLAADAAAAQERTLRPDPEPEKGLFYRSDHFEFAKVGVPALMADAGIDFIERPEGWGLEQRERYTAEDYHKPSDEVRPMWDLSGALEDLELFLAIGRRLAEGTAWPEWRESSEFRAVRLESRSGS